MISHRLIALGYNLSDWYSHAIHSGKQNVAVRWDSRCADQAWVISHFKLLCASTSPFFTSYNSTSLQSIFTNKTSLESSFCAASTPILAFKVFRQPENRDLLIVLGSGRYWPLCTSNAYGGGEWHLRYEEEGSAALTRQLSDLSHESRGLIGTEDSLIRAWALALAVMGDWVLENHECNQWCEHRIWHRRTNRHGHNQ